MLTEQTVKLKPENDETWDAWVVPPVPIFFNYYFFHVTNAADFEAGRAQKPSVVEVGPYAWEETREKVHINEIDVDLIQYGQFYEFYWSQRETDRWQLVPWLLRSCNNVYTVTAAVAAVGVAAVVAIEVAVDAVEVTVIAAVVVPAAVEVAAVVAVEVAFEVTAVLLATAGWAVIVAVNFFFASVLFYHFSSRLACKSPDPTQYGCTQDDQITLLNVVMAAVVPLLLPKPESDTAAQIRIKEAFFANLDSALTDPASGCPDCIEGLFIDITPAEMMFDG